jgi:hypothetical protein
MKEGQKRAAEEGKVIKREIHRGLSNYDFT